METVTLPLPFVLCFGGFLVGVFVTLVLLLDRRHPVQAPTVVVERTNDGTGCGMFLLLVPAALGAFVLAGMIAT